MGQRGFEPQSKRPKRSRIGQATLLSRNKTTAVLPSVLVNQLKAFPSTGTLALLTDTPAVPDPYTAILRSRPAPWQTGPMPSSLPAWAF